MGKGRHKYNKTDEQQQVQLSTVTKDLLKNYDNSDDIKGIVSSIHLYNSFTFFFYETVLPLFLNIPNLCFPISNMCTFCH